MSTHAQLTREVEIAQDFEADAREAYERALGLVGGRGAVVTSGGQKVTPKEFAALKSAYEHLVGCRARVQATIEAVSRADRQQAQAQSRLVRERHLRGLLTQQYGDLGPQYALLVDRLVAVATRAEILEQDPDGFTLEEYAKLVYQVKALIDQLQKHTESVKSEIFTRQLELRVVHVLELVERVIAPESPVLWQRALQSVADALPRLEHVPQLQAEN